MIRLRVPGTLNYRSVALRVVTEACKLAQGRDAEQELEAEADDFEAQTVSAFSEAFNNIAIHGYAGVSPGQVGPVDIEVTWTSDQIVLQLTDTGESFDPDTIGPPELDELPEGGMGLFIIRSFMDEVDYHPGPPNVLRLKKRLGSPDESAHDDRPLPSKEASKDASRPDAETSSSSSSSSSSMSDRRVKALAGAAERAPTTRLNEGMVLGEPGADPTPLLAARLVGGSRRT